MSMKYSGNIIGFEPATLRLVAQFFSQLRATA
jgi:hypothetical protein